MPTVQMTGMQQLGMTVAAVKNFISKSHLQGFAEADCRALRVMEPDRVRIGLRLLKIDQIAISDELIESRLTSIYQTMKQLVDSCFLVMQGREGSISVYLGFHSAAPGTAERALVQTLTGNFPGIVCESLRAPEIEQVMGRIRCAPDTVKTVAAVSVVPSPRMEQKETESVQGMEKFMDTMQGRDFTAVILASPYTDEAVNRRILALESIYTSLSPLEKISVQDTLSRTGTLTDSAAQTLSNSISRNVSQAFSVGNSTGSFFQNGNGSGCSIFGINFSSQSGSGYTRGQTKGTTNTSGTSTSVGDSSMVGHAFAQSQGQSKTVVQTETNKEIQDLLEKIGRQIQRLKESEAQGLWDCCGYFISGANDTAIVAANSFQGIVTGDSTSVEQSVVALWQPTIKNAEPSNHTAIRNITESLSLGVAPVFSPDGIAKRTESIVTGRELSRMMSFPRKSAGDVSVIRMAAFGRNIHLIGTSDRREFLQNSFSVGRVLHMGRVEEQSDVRLELEKLNAHTFVCGATGVGKTTAVCGVLQKALEHGIPFTVIEPAKGEYGEIWGRLPGVEVYSTTPFRYRMLRLNPFAFEKNVHILEHIERLISVFSTAWPLYAAQPAVLRECVRLAYIKCGWDLRNSICLKKPARFPLFQNVLAELPGVIRRSKFVGEAKGNYEGALQTRLFMLTQGIFGELLCSESDISNEELFDRTAIIDLSRLGSPETLSLMMGVLLIRLYEHRISAGKRDSLHHITVLEEAHNILKRQSSQPQGEDVASVGNRSVEVLTKCITELRFTGEGFVIADQSPGELDTAAIKNTATKIIMRLQNIEDQQAAGAAAGMTEKQTEELSRLSRGAAVVMQEGWCEPVLTSLTEYRKPYSAKGLPAYGAETSYEDVCTVRGFLLKEILRQHRCRVFDLESCLHTLRRINGFSFWKMKDFEGFFRRFQRKYQEISGQFSSNEVRLPFYGQMVRELLDCADLFDIFPLPEVTEEMSVPYSRDPAFVQACAEWRKDAENALDNYCGSLTMEERDEVTGLLLLADGKDNSQKILVKAALGQRKQEDRS